MSESFTNAIDAGNILSSREARVLLTINSDELDVSGCFSLFTPIRCSVSSNLLRHLPAISQCYANSLVDNVGPSDVWRFRASITQKHAIYSSK